MGHARGGGVALALGFRNAIFPSGRRLSPLFYQGDQIFIFPAPISCLGDGCISQLTAFEQLRLLVSTVLGIKVAVQSA
jgi:hypothetical protein